MKSIRALAIYTWLVLLAVTLSGCGAFSLESAHAMSTPPAPLDPSPTLRPLPPTATAVVFQLKPSSTPLPTRTPAGLDVTYGYGPDNFPSYINPLTGLPAADPNLLERRPMAIKVTNFPRSVRPQWGLTQADHVYEYYLENEITRFIGVFYGRDASRVGPVRSGRFFDENIVRMYKAIFVFAYADDRVVDPWTESDLRNFLVIERPDNCPPLCRIGSQYNYNTLFADTQKLQTYIDERNGNNVRQNLDGLRFERVAPFATELGERLMIYYSFTDYNLWEYDAVTGRYLRYQESTDDQQGELNFEPLKDSLTDAQIAADNVVVLLIPHEYYIHTDTTEMVKMDFMGQGQAYAFRDGKMYPIAWRRDAPEHLLNLTYPDGRIFPLKPGNVWFQVVGETSTSGQTTEGSWRFDFKIP